MKNLFKLSVILSVFAIAFAFNPTPVQADGHDDFDLLTALSTQTASALLAAAPGIGKTSWLLRMVYEAAAGQVPAAIGCYEHTAEELRYRLYLQAKATIAGAHEHCAQEFRRNI